jgi:hypothetical protein
MMTEFPIGSVVAVTGTRNGRHGDVERALDKVRPRLVVVGCCPTGVDRAAREWCQHNGVIAVVVTAVWTPGGHLDRSAGPRRNSIMADVAKAMGASVCLAFPDDDSRGTWDAVSKMKRAGVRVEVVTEA